MKKKRELILTDDIGNIDDIVLAEEISFLMPYSDKLLGPILKKEKGGVVKSDWKK